MNSKDTKAAVELKDEVLDELRRVDRDLNSIQNRLTPGQVIDDLVFRPRSSSPRKTFDQLKANPVGATFLTLGTLLLMEDDGQMTYESKLRKKSGEVSEKARYQATLLKGSVATNTERLKEKAESVRGRASSLKEYSGKVSEVGEKLSSGIQGIKEISPEAIVAIGAGLGALTGMGIDVPVREENLAREKFGEKLSGLREEFEAAINESTRILKAELLDRLSEVDVTPFKKDFGEKTQSRA